MSLLIFSLGARVHCEDGEIRGKLTCVVTDAKSYQVTDLIVTRGFPWLSRDARVVPSAAVNWTTEDAVWLSLPGDDLASCAAYQESFLAIEDICAGTAPAFNATAGGYGTAPVAPTPVCRHLHHERAEYHLVMGRQTEVRTLHGLVGYMARLWVDQESSEIIYVVARKGLIRVDYRTIPAELIEEMSAEEILLATSHQEIEELPVYPT